MAIIRARTNDGIKLTFSLDLDRPVSVVGDFNGWDPAAHPLRPRTNGKRSAVVTLPPGSRAAFRYLADGGHFFDDPEADGYEDNGYGGTHGVVLAPPARPPAARPAPARKASARKSPARTATRQADAPPAAKPAAATKAAGRKPKA